MSETASSAWGRGSRHLSEMRPCAVCTKETRSHVLFVTDSLEAATEASHDHFIPVCHGCYTEHAAAEILEEYGEASSRIGELVGVDASEVVVAAAAGRYRRTERVKTLGSQAVQDVLRSLEPGDVLRFNERRDKWVILPHDVDSKVPDGVLHPLSRVGSDSAAGGLVESRAPFSDEIKLVTHDTREMEIRDIDAVEVVGHVPIEGEA